MSRLFFSRTPGDAAGAPRRRGPPAEVPGQRLLRGEAAARRPAPVVWDAGTGAGEPPGTAGEPVGEVGDLAGMAGEPAGTAGDLAGTAGEPAGTAGDLAGTAGELAGTAGEPTGEAGGPAEAQRWLAAARAEWEAAAAARAEAQALRDEAAAQLAAAAGALAAAQSQAEALRAAAESALAEAEARVSAAVAAARREALAAVEGELVQLAMAVARHILRQELTLRPEAVAVMVSEALARVAGDPAPQVWCAPADAALLQAAVGIQPEVRPGLAPGEFLVHSREGDVDGRLDAQVAEVAATLAEAAAGETEP